MDSDNRRIGVMGCENTVGVYFEVDERRCFCAHIKFDKPYATMSKDQAKRLQQQVLEKFKSVCERDKWSTAEQGFGACITVMCERPTYDVKGGKQNGPGWYIMKGLRDFMMDCYQKHTPKAVDALVDGWTAQGVSGPHPFQPYPVGELQEQLRKARTLHVHLQCLVHRIVPATTKPEAGQAFIIEYLSEGQSRKLRLRKEDGRTENISNGDVDVCHWLGVPEEAEEAEWSFSLGKV